MPPFIKILPFYWRIPGSRVSVYRGKMFELLVGTTWKKFDDLQRLFLEAKRLGAVKVIEVKDNLYIMKF